MANKMLRRTVEREFEIIGEAMSRIKKLNKSIVTDLNFYYICLKYNDMETIIIKPKNKNSIAFLKHLLQGLNDVESFEIVKTSDTRKKVIAKTNKEPKDELLESIHEAQTGKTKEMNNIEEYFKNIRKRANVKKLIKSIVTDLNFYYICLK